MKFVNKKLATACILSVMCAGFSSLGYAAEEKTQKEEIQSFALDEYVVTANRTEQTIFNANANINVITKADIERMHYDTLDKALTAVPGVQFQNYSGSPGLNAFMTTPVRINGSKNVLVLIDGVRMSPVGGGAAAVNMNFLNNMDNIERIEVLKGAAGVLYGSDAAGGVINIITKKDGESKTTLKASHGSFGAEAYHFSNRGTEGVMSWNVYYDKDLKGDFEDGRGVEFENKWDSHTAGIDLDFKVNDKQTLTLQYDKGKADFKTENLMVYSFNQDEIYKQKGFVETQNLTISHQWDFDENTTNQLTYRNGRKVIGFKEEYMAGAFGPMQGAPYKEKNISERFTKVFDEHHTVSIGADFNKTIAGKWVKDKFSTDSSIDWNRNIKNQSYYIQDKWTFDDKWNLTVGVRYDTADVTDDKESRKMDDNLSKSLNIAHNFDDRNNVYMSYDEYFIIPTADELLSPTYGNVNLDPAKGKNYSIGYNHIIDENSSVSVHAFQRKADVSIGLAIIGESHNTVNSQYGNFKNAKDTGFDIQYNKRFDDKWNAFVGYSFLKHESEDGYHVDTLKLGYLPRHAVNLGVNYTYDKWDIGLTGRGFLSRDDAEAAGSENDKTFKMNWPNDHYWVFNIAANYQATKNVKVFAAVNNIFDQMYAESMVQGIKKIPMEYYSMPGRSFVAGVEVSF